MFMVKLAQLDIYANNIVRNITSVYIHVYIICYNSLIVSSSSASHAVHKSTFTSFILDHIAIRVYDHTALSWKEILRIHESIRILRFMNDVLYIHRLFIMSYSCR